MSEQNTPDGQGPGGPGGGGPNPWIRSLMIWGGVFERFPDLPLRMEVFKASGLISPKLLIEPSSKSL